MRDNIEAAHALFACPAGRGCCLFPHKRRNCYRPKAPPNSIRRSRRLAPKVQQPSHRVEIFKPDAVDKAVIAEDEEPEPQTLADHPRAYYVDKLQPPRKPPVYSKPERDVGSGREGIGRGPDPEKIGPHVGFRVPQR